MTFFLTLSGYLALGALAGTLAGLFGIGGGLVIVPALVFAFTLQGLEPAVLTHLAVGTSLATILFTSLSSIRTHHRLRGVRWDLVRPMAGGIVLGAALGAWTASLLSGEGLQSLIGVFVILAALKMGLDLSPRPGPGLPGNPGLALTGGGIGWLSAIFGIGGGTLTVPFLSWCNVRMQEAVGTAAACGFPIALAGALANMVVGWDHPGLPAGSAGYVYLPAFAGIVALSVPFARLGARLAHRLSPQRLKRFFALLLVIVGLRFLFS